MNRTLLAAVFVFVAVIAASASPREKIHREFTRTKERSLRVVIDIAFGSLMLEPGARDRIATIEYDEAEDDEHKIIVSYDVSGDRGLLKIRLKKSSHFWGDGDSDRGGHDRQLAVRLTENLPVSLEIELGAGRGDIDLSRLRVEDLKISTGASSVNVRCDQPNPISANDVEFESGVSKFTASNLSNMNFRSLKFSGGVGSYKLDFGGKLRQNADVKIEVGLGSVVVNVPGEIPARLLYDDSWLSSFDLDDGFSKQRSGLYQTDDFDGGSNHLTIRIESGLGSVKVRRK